MSQIKRLATDFQIMIETYGLQAVMLAAAELLQWECRKCGHTWAPRLQAGRPLQCPRCKSRSWSDNTTKEE